MSIDGSTLPYRPCVGIMVLNRGGQVWVGRRPDAPAEPEGPGGWWQMPQGGIDEGEDAGQGGACASSRRRPASARSRSSPRARLVHLRSAGGAAAARPGAGATAARSRSGSRRASPAWTSEIDIVPQPGHQAEFDAWRWAAIGDLIGLIVPFKRAVYEQVVRDFARLARAQPLRGPLTPDRKIVMLAGQTIGDASVACPSSWSR